MSSDENREITLFNYGSLWIKADFHLHTRADNEFIYTGEENSYLNDYVGKLKEQNIRLGLITNHNKFDKDEFRNLLKKALKEEIYLLPGVELSVNDGSNGIHTLVIFSDQWLENGQDYINPFISSMFPGKSESEYQQENGRSDKNILQVIEELEKTNRDYFLIFAHVEQRNGLWEEMKGGKLSDFSENRYADVRQKTLGFQKVRTHDVKDRVCRTKVKSWLKDWYPAEVEGSDCKSIDDIKSDDLTWLKIGSYTFEAIKYALSDYSNRVSSTIPEGYKHSYIKSISFEGGILNNNIVSFSPELNSLIGIRGSGKSSILEAIRYTLGIRFGEKAMDTDYKQNLIKHTFGSGGLAIITAIDRYGQEYEIKKILNEATEVSIEGKLQPGVSIKETIIHKPIYFGQKDLSSTGEGFEKDLVEKLVGEKLYEIRKQIEEKKQTVSDSVNLLKNLSSIDEKKSEYTQKKLDAEFNLKKFIEYGVNDKFKKQTDYELDERRLNQIVSNTVNFIATFREMLSQHEDELRNNKAYQSIQNEEFFTDFFKEYESIINILDRVKKDQENGEIVLQNLKEKIEDFKTAKEGFLDEFAKTRRKLEEELKSKGAEALNLEEFPQLQKQIDTAKQMLEALDKQQLQKDSIKNDLLAALSTLNGLWQQEYQLINNELNKINENHSALTIEGEFKGDKKGFLSFMQSMFRGSNIREATLSHLVENYSDFGSMYKDLENVKTNAGSSPETFERYFIDNLQTLLTWQVSNRFIIKYREKELKHHSLGQRASALILFVLSQQENDLIIIDQPEDDLDNQTIYEDVIKLIRQLKYKTQFIFATHNANFPVLGDAEQIHSCRYSDDKLNFQSGSIDSPLLQKEIVDIMEGGEIAFNRRKEIYEIWKPLN